MADEFVRLFQEKTKYERSRLAHTRITEKWPGRYKRYPGAPRITLPPPKIDNGATLWSCLQKRRSVRFFQERSINLDILSLLLWASQGITEREGGLELRAAPSAGALYPVETYLSVQNVESLPAGIYHYDVAGHALERIKTGNFGRELARASLNQNFLALAAVVFIWTAIFARSTWKYRERAFRYIYLDTGHLAENLALAAVACDLGSCQVGAFYDQEINFILSVDGEKESTVYLSAVGFPARLY